MQGQPAAVSFPTGKFDESQEHAVPRFVDVLWRYVKSRERMGVCKLVLRV